MKERFAMLSWKHKNALFFGMVLIFSWIVYSYAISLTLDLSAECGLLEQQIDSSGNLTVEVEQLKAEITTMGEHSGAASFLTHEQLLDLVAGYNVNRKLVLKEFPSSVRFRRDQWEVEVHRITVEGSFVDTVQFLEFLRQSGKGKVVSADFCSKQDNKTKRKYLITTIYVQCIYNSHS